MAFQHREEHTDERMLVIQANIDDMNPELYAHVMDKLFAAGANDVYLVPIIMKKGRPGIMLNVLINDDLLEEAEKVIFTETTTLGIRYMRAECHRLGRTFSKVSTPWGEISVKAGFYKGELVQFAPGFQECREAADQHGVPLKLVYDEVKAAYRRQQGDN